MPAYVKIAHTALFIAPTGVGKSYKVLDLLEKEYRGHFENIIILCPTIRWNKTYQERSWIWKDENVFLINPEDKLSVYIEKLSHLLAGEETLFIVDDILTDENLDKRRSSLLEMSASGRHKQHSLWLLTQSYTAVLKDIRRQVKQLFTWYPKDRHDLRIIHEENDVMSNDELAVSKQKLMADKHACLFMRIEHPREWEIV